MTSSIKSNLIMQDFTEGFLGDIHYTPCRGILFSQIQNDIHTTIFLSPTPELCNYTGQLHRSVRLTTYGESNSEYIYIKK
jgi:hypothetical protein